MEKKNEKKTCVLLYLGFLMFSGSESQSLADTVCLGDKCAWGNSKDKECAVLTIAKMAKGDTKNLIK